MNLGDKLYELRKSKNLSQEEVAEKLNVSRQTISKWETNQSTPDFDKILPLCELYNITTDELIKGEIKEETVVKKDISIYNKKRAFGISIGVLCFFIAVIWIMLSLEVFNMDEVVSSSIFLMLTGIGTSIIIYTVLSTKRVQKEEKDKKENTIKSKIDSILSIIVLIIYMIISFKTMVWHITWIIWIIYAVISKIIDLVLEMRGYKDEE